MGNGNKWLIWILSGLFSLMVGAYVFAYTSANRIEDTLNGKMYQGLQEIKQDIREIRGLIEKIRP